MVSAGRRDEVLHQAIEALKADQRVTGAVLIGSGATGYVDDLSDIDMLVVVAKEADLEPVRAGWAREVHRLFPVLHHARTPYTEANRLHIFMLDGLLELDTSFVALAALQPPREGGRILFDRTGAVVERLTHADRPESGVAGHLYLFDQACHRVLECRKALYRGRLWQASIVLDELRAITAQVAGLVYVGSSRQRDLDRLPAEILDVLAETIVPVNAERLQVALWLLTSMMLDLAERLYEDAGVAFPHRFGAALREAVIQAQPPSGA